MKRYFNLFFKCIILILKAALCICCIGATASLLYSFIFTGTSSKTVDTGVSVKYMAMERFDKYMTNVRSDTLDGVMSIKKVYWLSDTEVIAPEPNPEGWGESSDPAEMQWLLDEAAELLDGQSTLFTTETNIYKGSKVTYYYDPTILSVTWKQLIGNSVYNISEIKIADPSQFRRFLSDGEYGSGSKYLTSQMASTVNAVTAANGDYYAMRQMGTVVYNSQVMRAEGRQMDTCFIDRNGDMQFIEVGEMTDPAEIRNYVESEGVRFCLSFGPILIEDGEICNIKTRYPVGEVGIPNARAALCQLDSLHYLLVIASVEPPYDDGVTLVRFADALHGLGCDKAYNLDGGRSASLVTNDKLMNYVYERLISDIIYFATAIPDGE